MRVANTADPSAPPNARMPSKVFLSNTEAVPSTGEVGDVEDSTGLPSAGVTEILEGEAGDTVVSRDCLARFNAASSSSTRIGLLI